jgi:hypothetical protein
MRQAAGAKKFSSEALFSELLGSTVFIRPRAVVTCGAPGAVLRREAGAGAHGTCVGPEVILSREVGTRAVVTRGAPRAALRGPGATLSREVGTGATVTRGAPGATPSRSIVGCFLVISS